MCSNLFTDRSLSIAGGYPPNVNSRETPGSERQCPTAHSAYRCGAELHYAFVRMLWTLLLRALWDIGGDCVLYECNDL